MATKLKELPAAAQEITSEKITELFMHYCLENNKKPESVYLFCKQNGMAEKDFYKHFSSIDAIEKSVFVSFHKLAVQLMDQSEDIALLGFRDKLLTYYYTYFEILTANRSYVILTLKEGKNRLNSLLKLKDFRTHFKAFISQVSEGYLKAKSERIRKAQQDALEEGAWIQFLVTLKFWLDDESIGFEKTDLFIEKSIRATFDLIDTTPLESVIDFGKFLIKETLR
ncbi:TetR family transcriptional regulator C-terminal domain-containing protein [Dyadobacter aurulentus]|uniref:TetR family transcriptional regulator C-terminal domain-containing protein n=1 Tax=Dyadobacter sp. UC 10 TaxID=2605428 RepID=UPI0011F3D784|nr:TetR family transcriptional regulator C-terminal domain-containing protein [Dyadobacter sp. UC 10]KAA0990093.1 TetR/AcrR family transcriptional regulator [Dyadobacter sp. UC 10]